MIGGSADIKVSISSMVIPVDSRARSRRRLVMQQRLQAVRVSSAEHSSSASVTIMICLNSDERKTFHFRYLCGMYIGCVKIVASGFLSILLTKRRWSLHIAIIPML